MKIAALLAILLVSAPAAASPAAPAAPAKQAVGSTCRRLPAGRRIVKLNLKPNTDLGDLISWISSITCKQFVLGNIPVSSKTVTIISPQLITVEEAYGLFVTALDSVGLTVYPAHGYLRVIETSKAKTSPVRLVISDEADTAAAAAAVADAAAD